MNNKISRHLDIKEILSNSFLSEQLETESYLAAKETICANYLRYGDDALLSNATFSAVRCLPEVLAAE